MAWLDYSSTFAVAFVVLFAPGAVVAVILRLRGFTVLAVAAPLSIALLAAAALVNIALPFRWGPGVWGISVVVLLVAAFTVRIVVMRLLARGAISAVVRAPHKMVRELVPFFVVAVCAVVSIPRLAHAFGAPDNISQTFDNIYHLNAVRQIMDDGLIAPTRQLLPGFYPDLWHVIVSTVAQMSGAGVAASVNVVSIVLGAIVWPIACIWFVRSIAGAHLAATVAAGALSIGMAAFPLLMLDFGVLYPNVLAISLLPSALAALVSVSGIGTDERPDIVVRWILLVAVVPSLALAHPSTLMAFLLPAFWISMVGFALWRRRSRLAGGSARVRRWAAGALVALFVVAAALFIVARPNQVLAFWPPSATFEEAITQLISGGIVWRPASWAVSVAVALGIVTICALGSWRRHWWLIVSTVVLAFVYVVCISFPYSWFRYGVTGTWYQDVYRIAALMPSLLVPLGALGAVGIVALVTRLLRTKEHRRLAWIPSTVAVAAAVGVLFLTQTGAALAEETENTAAMYAQHASSPLLSNDERALLQRLPDIVPAEEVIVGNPWTGTSLSFALADRRALVPHIFQALSPEMITITESLNQAHDDPDVCVALDRTDVKWVLDFGVEEIHNGDHSYSGLNDLGDVARLVDSEGEARLYEIMACR